MVLETVPSKVKNKREVKPEGIVVAAQQSRFYVDATDTPTLKEIDVRDLDLSINGRDLLAGAHLRLEDGVHYVLVGRNGSGKSTLLKAVSEERVPGVAANLHCLLLGQMAEEKRGHTGGGADGRKTALEHVLRSDAKAERVYRQSQALATGLNSGNAVDGIRAYRRVNHERLEYTLKRAQLIASRRSGARGWDARAELNRIETLVQESSRLLEQAETDLESTTIAEETKAAVQLLDELQTYLDSSGSSTANARARSLLSGLRFSAEMIDSPFSSLSGGWRMRCELASALFQQPDVLMLDEPTNFLDLPTVIWLESYIKDCTCTVVVVTHDRDFADAIGEELIVLRDEKLEPFAGNLSLYEQEKASKIKQMRRMQGALDKKTAHMEKSIQSNVAAAKRTGDDKKLKQAASRKKKLEERTGLEVSAKGTRFKLNRDLAGYHTTSRAGIDIPQDDPQVKMSFPFQPADLRFPGALLHIEKVSFKYPAAKASTLQGVDLAVHLGDRIGLVGANGTGKSTLVSLAVGQDGGGLEPTAGTTTRHPRLRLGYFSQHATEELGRAKEVNGQMPTALSHLMAVAGADLSESKARSILGDMGLPGRLAADVPIMALSGGQRVRLALAELMWRPPQLLILDEVTTHLDADTIVALIEALETFEGAILCVTHDRFFMRCVVEGENPTRPGEEDEDADSSQVDESHKARRRIVYRMKMGGIKELSGGMDQYEEIAQRSAKKHER